MYKCTLCTTFNVCVRVIRLDLYSHTRHQTHVRLVRVCTCEKSVEGEVRVSCACVYIYIPLCRVRVFSVKHTSRFIFFW